MDGRQILMVSGLSGHSAYVVDRVSLVRHSDRLQMLVTLKMSGEAGMRGDFEEMIVIPDWAERITFGENEAVIWERDESE